jgi:hypothetical protein
MKRHNQKSSSKQFKEDLCVKEDGYHWLNDAEFKRKYQVSRITLNRITLQSSIMKVLTKVPEVQIKSLSNISDWDRSSDISVVGKMSGILISVVEEDRRIFNITVGGICSTVV